MTMPEIVIEVYDSHKSREPLLMVEAVEPNKENLYQTTGSITTTAPTPTPQEKKRGNKLDFENPKA